MTETVSAAVLTVFDHLRAGVGGVVVTTIDPATLAAEVSEHAKTEKVRCTRWSADEAETEEEVDLSALTSAGIVLMEHSAEALNSVAPVLLAQKRRNTLSDEPKILVLVVPSSEGLSGALRNEYPVVQHALPDQARLAHALRDFDPRLDATHAADAAVALAGLTRTRALDTYALVGKRLGQQVVPTAPQLVEAKMRAFESRPYLRIEHPKAGFESIVGHDGLKDWLRQRRVALLKQKPLPMPKGVLLVGPPGTGKTVFAGATAYEWGVGWLTLEVGALFTKWLGESEERLEEVIQIATSMSPCVLLIDEVDLAFSSDNTGTSSRMLGRLLSWMAGKEDPVFVMMTSNFADNLPAALLRRGRLDQLFCLDVPTLDEVQGILEHYLRKVSPEIGVEVTRTEVADLVRELDGCVPAEIRAIVEDAQFAAVHDGSPVRYAHILRERDQTVPICISMADQVDAMRAWAQRNARSTGA